MVDTEGIDDTPTMALVIDIRMPYRYRTKGEVSDYQVVKHRQKAPSTWSQAVRPPSILMGVVLGDSSRGFDVSLLCDIVLLSFDSERSGIILRGRLGSCESAVVRHHNGGGHRGSNGCSGKTGREAVEATVVHVACSG